MKIIFPHGINYCIRNDVPVYELMVLLNVIWSYIVVKNETLKVLIFDDWLEHDGLHFFRNEMDAESFVRIISSEEKILNTMPGDDFVHVGVCAKDMNWYLRYYVDFEDNMGLGVIDISIPKSWELDFDGWLKEKTNTNWVKEDAKAYYKRITR